LLVRVASHAEEKMATITDVVMFRQRKAMITMLAAK